jgi:serine/threonine protein kinase
MVVMKGQVLKRSSETAFCAGDMIDDRYQVLTCLDGYRVYLVRDMDVENQLFAAKVSLREDIFTETYNLRREYITHSYFDNQNIVKVLSPFETESHFGFLMEYLGGGDLANYMQMMGAFQEQTALSIIRSVLAGLSEIHQKKFIHADIKPENILLTTDGIPKLSDFGVTRMLNEGKDETDVVRGTFQYLCPVYVQSGRIAQDVDTYAVGLIAYELFSGQHRNKMPLYDNDPVKMIKLRLSNDFPELSGLENDKSGSISRAISRALSRNPEERFKNADEFLLSLPELIVPKEIKFSENNVVARIEKYFAKNSRARARTELLGKAA